jgi:type I restriction enzyme S subunit
MRCQGVGDGMMPLYSSAFLKTPALLPPIEEQINIVDGIARATSELNSAITRYEREIELLREYRTRLTADVVTGKLDVREAAKSLPAESPEDISGSPLDSTDLESDLAEEEELEESDIS